MYKVMVYGLVLLLGVAEIFAITDTISISPIGLPISVFILLMTTYPVDMAFAKIYKVPFNYESAPISAFIVASVLFPVHNLTTGIWFALAGIIAIASKYVIAYKGMHVFNPAAFAIFVVSLIGYAPAGWWMATPPMLPFVALVGLIILRKQKHITLFAAFAVSAVAVLLLIGTMSHGQAVGTILHSALYSWPIIFFGTVMLTEPSTMPSSTMYRYVFAVLVGCLFSLQASVGPISTTPQFVLLVGNLFAFIIAPATAALLTVRGIKKLTPDTFQLTFNTPPKGRLSFRPGQYMDFTLDTNPADARGNRRTFSVASAPTDDGLSVVFRRAERSSTFKAAALKLKPGETMRVSRPRGDFVLPTTNKPLLFIAGGIGITPFLSMISHLIDKQIICDVQLLYLSAKDDYIYNDLLTKAASIGVRTQYIAGRLTSEELSKAVPDLQQRIVYISGPDAMVTAYKQLVRGLGAKQVKTDHFTGY